MEYCSTPNVRRGNLIAAVTSTECHVVLGGNKYKVDLCMIELTCETPQALTGHFHDVA